MSFDSHGISDRGQRRVRNEDSLIVDQGRGLYVVCDGMGGHVGGEVASHIAAETIAEFVRSRRDEDWPFGRVQGLSPEADVLRNAALLANRRIAERIEKEPELASMGTTMVAALVEGDGQVHLAHVGDSRAYVFRGGQLQQLTSDHSWVNEQVRAGALSPSEAERHPFKNVITRALGSNGLIPVDIAEEKLAPGDCLVLCSDGLTGMVGDDVIAGVLREEGANPEAACRRLVSEANRAGGEDNITVALIVARSPARGRARA